ncbi:hypothetical protein [Deinococcus aluminii]|uniref:Uncharacterized protein n=1 Tax=Deinococcus aluminii TaxID=1656885 RepID=A0ABP9XES0_9DEIO
MPHPAPLAAAVTALSGLPVSFALSRFGPAAIHVVGKPASPCAHLSLYVHENDLPALAQELPGHLAAPPVWTAWLDCHAPHPLEWVWGYQQARRLCLPRHGVFQARAQLEPELHCQHIDLDILRARLHGMLSYLLHIPRADRPVPTLNAAD